MRDAPARFSKVTSRMNSPKGKDPDNYVAKTAAALFLEMRQHGLTKKLGLADTVVSPNLQHDVRAACGAILFDPLDAFVRSPGNGAHFAQNLVTDSFGRCFTAAFFHDVGNRLQLFEGQPRAFEKHVRGSLYILHLIGEIHRCLFSRAFFSFSRVAADAADDDRTERQFGSIPTRFARTLLHIFPGVAHKCRRGDACGQQAIADAAGEFLENGPRSSNVYARNPPRRVRVRLQCRDSGGEYLTLIFKRITFEHPLDNFDAFAHHGRRADLFAFTLADFFHEYFGSSKPEEKAVARKVLHYARFHSHLNRMSRVRRNDAPAKLNAPRLRGDDGENRRRRARLKAVLAPPGIGFRDPERIEAGIFAGFRHRSGFAHRLHTQLQNADIEWHTHALSCAPLVRVLPGVLETLDQSP